MELTLEEDVADIGGGWMCHCGRIELTLEEDGADIEGGCS